mgnify:CR=1 FL=1
MAEFNDYSTPMDQNYMAPADVSPGAADVEKPLFPISELGQTVTEGARFGTLINTVQGAIRAGAGQIELQTGMGGGAEAVGAEAYGKDARETLREMARANDVNLSSVHIPTQVGNLSGLGQQGFSDEQRHMFLEEVKKAVKFAAETTGGGAIVVHTGEYQRPMFDASWNKEGKWKGAFIGYDEEPERATKILVDRRTGRLVQEIRMNQVIHRPDWNTAEKEESYAADELDVKRGMASAPGELIHVKPGDYIDYDGKKLKFQDRVARWDNEKNEFELKPYKWYDFEKEAQDFNRLNNLKPGDPDYRTPEEAAFKAQVQSQIAIARGWKLNYSKGVEDHIEGLNDLKKQLAFYEKIEKEIPEEELWKYKKEVQNKIAGLVGKEFAPPSEQKLPTEIIKEGISDLRKMIEQEREMSLGQDQNIKEQEENLKNIISVSKYAKTKSMHSYAEAGIYAWKETEHNPYADKSKPIFVAPENLFPEMGYGTHPEELIELVKDARKEMVKHLTEKYIEDPAGKVLREDEVEEHNKRWGLNQKPGEVRKVVNKDYTGMNRSRAENIAKKHIKATLDTQHLGMWWKHFKPKPGETEQDRRERFNEWYMDEVEKLQKEEIVGNVHLVDSIGGGHHHLPAGQGDLPLKDALTYMKEKGFTGTINSEAHGEAQFGTNRMLVETWKALGSPIYSMAAPGAAHAAPRTWGDIHQSYFGQTRPPYFIFGAYAPSNEFQLWTEVPLE